MLEVETTQILDLILPDFKRFLALAAPGGDADGRLRAAPESVQPEAQGAGRVLVGHRRRRAGGRELRYTVPDYFNGRLRIVAIGGQRASRWAWPKQHRGEGRLHPDAERAGDGGAGRRVPGQRRRLQQHHRDSGPIRLEAQQPGRGLSLAGPGERRSADRGEERKASPSSASRPRRAGRGVRDLRRAARPGRARVEESISVRPAVAVSHAVHARPRRRRSAQRPLTRDVYSEQRRVDAAVSTLPLVWGQGLTAYLEGYEYSCTEQLVSKGMAALILTTRPEFGAIVARNGERPLDATFCDAARPRQRRRRLRVVGVDAGHGGVPDRLRRALPRRGEGARPGDPAGLLTASTAG